MGLEASSGVERPRPITLRVSFSSLGDGGASVTDPLSLGDWDFGCDCNDDRTPLIAASSSSGGKCDTQLLHRSSILPFRGRL